MLEFLRTKIRKPEVVTTSGQPTNNSSLGAALLNYIQKGFPIAPRWSIISCVILLALFVFVGVSAASGAPWTVDFNAAVAGFIQSWRSPELTGIMQGLSFIGSEVATAFIVLVILVVMAVKRHWDDFIYVLGNFVVVEALLLAGKFLFCVTRPQDQAIIELPDSFSYPSGHTGCSMIAALLIAMLLVVWLRKKGAPQWVTPVATFVLVLVALAVAASRVYLGVHWGTDLVGGWCVALGWGLPTFAWFVKQYPASRFDDDYDPYGVKAIKEKQSKEDRQ